jgi:hypothetical protein
MPEMTDLNFSKAVFACSDMDAGENTQIHTAYKTFVNAELDRLQSLNFDNVTFAAEGMSTGTNTKVYIASNTFLNTNLSFISLLNLIEAKFAVPNMSVSGELYIAAKTFEDANLKSMDHLVYDQGKRYTKFACAEMSQTGLVYTGYYTFKGTDLSSIDENLLQANNMEGIESLYNTHGAHL